MYNFEGKTIALTFIQEQAARVRVCNSVKFETSRKLPPVLKMVTCTAHARHKPLLLST